MTFRGISAGCALVIAVAGAALLLTVSFAFTVEAEWPEAFPGLHENRSGFAAAALVLAVVLLTGAVVVLRRAFRRAGRGLQVVLVAVSCACALLVGVAGYRAWLLAPMSACAGHDALAREPDGSYECFDR